MKKELPVYIVFVISMLMIVSYFLTVPGLKTAATQVNSWVVIIANFALGLGAVSLVQVHSKKITNKSKDWNYSVILLISLAITVLIGILQGQSSASYKFIFQYIFTDWGTAMYALLAFFLASASYRAFRARNVEATILLIGAIIMMLGNVPIGALIWSGWPNLAKWVQNVPNTAGQRAIMISAAVGYIGISLRVMLGMERKHFGGQ